MFKFLKCEIPWIINIKMENERYFELLLFRLIWILKWIIIKLKIFPWQLEYFNVASKIDFKINIKFLPD